MTPSTLLAVILTFLMPVAMGVYWVIVGLKTWSRHREMRRKKNRMTRFIHR